LGCSIFLLAIAKSYERFFTVHNSRSSDKIKTRLEEIRSAAAATHDSAVTTASLSAALAFVRILRELWMRLAYDQYEVRNAMPAPRRLPGRGLHHRARRRHFISTAFVFQSSLPTSLR
jgi:hypothetical protein